MWLVIAIFTTICLLSYNKYNVPTFGTYSLLKIDNKDLEPTFNKYDLAIIDKDGPNKYKVGDKIFFYFSNVNNKTFINFGEITEVNNDEKAENSYKVGGTFISYSDILGKFSDTKKINNMGLFMSIMESRWGYMFLVILPTLFILVYEIYAIVDEVRKEALKEFKEE